MDITEVRVNLIWAPKGKVRAFCSITFDNAFAVHDIAVIEGAQGPYVAMPRVKFTRHCVICARRNHIRANFCNECGVKLPQDESLRDINGQVNPVRKFRNVGNRTNINDKTDVAGLSNGVKLYADIAHPINRECRELIHQKILKAYQDALNTNKKSNV